MTDMWDSVVSNAAQRAMTLPEFKGVADFSDEFAASMDYNLHRSTTGSVGVEVERELNRDISRFQELTGRKYEEGEQLDPRSMVLTGRRFDNINETPWQRAERFKQEVVAAGLQDQFDLDYAARVRATFAEVGERYRDVQEMSPGGAQALSAELAGGAVSALLDPVNVMAMGAGGAIALPGSTVLGRVTVQTGLGMLAEAVTTPQKFQTTPMLGETFSTEDALTEIGIAGLTAGAVTGAGLAVAAGVRRAVDPLVDAWRSSRVSNELLRELEQMPYEAMDDMFVSRALDQVDHAAESLVAGRFDDVPTGMDLVDALKYQPARVTQKAAEIGELLSPVERRALAQIEQERTIAGATLSQRVANAPDEVSLTKLRDIEQRQIDVQRQAAEIDRVLDEVQFDPKASYSEWRMFVQDGEAKQRLDLAAEILRDADATPAARAKAAWEFSSSATSEAVEAYGKKLSKDKLRLTAQRSSLEEERKVLAQTTDSSRLVGTAEQKRIASANISRRQAISSRQLGVATPTPAYRLDAVELQYQHAAQAAIREVEELESFPRAEARTTLPVREGEEATFRRATPEEIDPRFAEFDPEELGMVAEFNEMLDKNMLFRALKECMTNG